VSLPSSTSLRLCYQTILTPDHFQQLRSPQAGHQGIYAPPLVIWLMIWQQLYGNRTLAAAVQQVRSGQPCGLLGKHKRIREGTVSANTGAYSEARKRLTVDRMSKVAQHLFDEVLQLSAEPARINGVYLLDGSGLLLAHNRNLVKAFPPARNQHGISHWPVMRVLVAHNLANGAALEPCWGPMFGKAAVSEQSLAEKMLQRLPAKSVLLGDRNFGVLSVAYAARSQGHDVLVRLTKVRAQKIMGGSLPKRKAERNVQWRPSRDDRRAHPKIPKDACIEGRLVIRHVRRGRQVVVLYLFTTLSLPADELVQLYGRRWNIETDLRSLKQTLHLGHLRCQSQDMVAKELIAGVMAYNLVRAVQIAAAKETGVEPRQMSFAQVLGVVTTWLPRLLVVSSQPALHKLFQGLLRSALPHRLIKRKRRRRYPRAIWSRPQEYARRTVGKK
jgi:hypothetical protein